MDSLHAFVVVRLVCQSDPVQSDKTDGWTHLHDASTNVFVVNANYGTSFAGAWQRVHLTHMYTMTIRSGPV